MGDIGPVRRRVDLEPMPESVPVAEPSPVPEPVKEPVGGMRRSNLSSVRTPAEANRG